jgi:1-pyrroline-5-carboxylate dehydrogenase
MLLPYQNEPVTDFSVPANEVAMLAALEKVKSELGQTYPLVIGGETIYRDDVFASVNPSRPDEAGRSRSQPKPSRRGSTWM